LKGNLILIGSGDPTLSTDDLIELVDAAVAAGLKRVEGNLFMSPPVFPANPVSDHWVWGDLGNAYGAGAYSLNLDHNRIPVSFEPAAKAGDPAPLRDSPRVPRDTRWLNYVTTGEPGSGDQVVIYSAPYGRTITLRGTVPAGESGFTVNGALPDPPALVEEIVRERLAAAGVKIAGGPTSTTFTTDTLPVLARHTSEALPEIIDHLHRVSDNLETQCLFLTIGRKKGADAAAAIRAHYESAGVSFVGLRLLDGSGLARANVIRPLDLARANFATRRGVHGQRFYESLSQYLDGEVRAKIGSMSGVKTQVGFLRTKGGEEFTFAVMGNSLPAGRDFWGELEKLLGAVREIED
jgi:D-alanyl-D-alanine carboxypeptidase/D-alanyl-D-alanine-endopeptidase (penicillin-binding protein 4)